MTGRPLSESQRKQLAAIRNMWKGKSLLSSESAWTSEARQPQLKELELKQLEFAHELRRKMETAATLAERASSSQDIRPLLLDTIPDMHRLVSLTEAVRGGYVLPHYNEYIGEFKRQEENRLQQVTQAKEILQHQSTSGLFEAFSLQILKELGTCLSLFAASLYLEDETLALQSQALIEICKKGLQEKNKYHVSRVFMSDY